MSTYFPPKKGTDPSPQVGHPPAVQRREGPDAATPEAQAVIDSTAASLNAWLSQQRQNVANSITSYHRARFDHPAVEADYVNHDGRETFTVRPKPVPVISPEVVAKEQENAKADDEPVPLRKPSKLPDATKYLMVLYDDDKIAAVRMDDLPEIKIEYSGKARDSSWTSPDYPYFKTTQAKIDGTEYVLLPLDMTGKDAAKSFYLSTTALTDGCAVDSTCNSVPIMNGNKDNIFAIGGSYKMNKGKLELVTAPVHEVQYGIQNRVMPMAIEASDGLGYVLPYLQSTVLCGIDKTNTNDYTYSKGLDDAFNKSASDATTSNHVSSYASAVIKFVIDKNTYYYVHGSSQFKEVNQLDSNMAVLTVGPFDTPPSVSTYTYYGVAHPGEIPQIKNFEYTLIQTKQLSYAGGGLFTLVGEDVGSGTLTAKFPLMSTTVGGDLSVSVVDVNVQLDDTTSVDFSGPTGPIGAGTLAPHNVITINESSGDPDTRVSSIGQIFGLPAGDDLEQQPDFPTRSEAVEFFKKYVQSAAARLGRVTAQEFFDAIPVVFTTQLDGSVSAEGEFGTDHPSGNYNGDLIALAGSGNGVSASASSSTKLPRSQGVQVTGQRKTTLTAFGQTLTAIQHGAVDQDQVIIEPFPYMLDEKPWWFTADTKLATVHTPYGNYTVTDFEQTYGGSFVRVFYGWLNLSNGKHLIQGFIIGRDTRYAFFDGDHKTNLIDGLVKALNTDQAKIRTMVMDVPLDTIKAVANVKAPVYS